MIARRLIAGVGRQNIAGKRVAKEHRKLSEKDLRPPVWIGHVVLETDRLEETEQFMRKIGMRSIVRRPEVAVLELAEVRIWS